MSESVGVVVMAYGSAADLDDIESYYTHLRGGRPPSAELLEELTRRYAAIGGVSPLRARTEAQVRGIQGALDERAPGRFDVRIGYKHVAPFVEDTVDALADDGVGALVGLVLAPHFSATSVGEYLARAGRRAEARGLELTGVRQWHLEPAYVDFLAAQVEAGLAELPDATKVLFTAHSLPVRVLAGDPYPAQVRETAAAVAAVVGLDRWAGWSVAWQSAARTPEPWMGPNLLDVIADLAGTGRAEGVLVCACGFVSDHLEVLYDLDIEARRAAEGVGLAFARTAALNDDAVVMAALAELMHRSAEAARQPPSAG